MPLTRKQCRQVTMVLVSAAIAAAFFGLRAERSIEQSMVSINRSSDSIKAAFDRMDATLSKELVGLHRLESFPDKLGSDLDELERSTKELQGSVERMRETVQTLSHDADAVYEELEKRETSKK